MREEVILRRLQARDPAGLEALMERYIPYISAVVWNILRCAMQPEDAEEVVSDVFLTAWNQAEQLETGYVKQWLAAVARNKAKNKLRQLGRELPLEEDYLELPSDSDPADAAEKAEKRTLVTEAVNSLGDQDRELFLRHYYYAQTINEISKDMALNESTVKTRLRRGRMKLKDFLMRRGME